jgi:hypothetical protein
MEYLAEKANEGMLTVDEETEYRHLIEVTDLLALLQAKSDAAGETSPDE